MAPRSTRSGSTATRTGDTTVGDPGPDTPPADGVPVVEATAVEPLTGPAPDPTPTGEAVTAADLAARRRRGERTTDPAAIPPGAAPAPVDGVTPVSVIASRTLVSQFGAGGPARPTGGVWGGKPLVVEVNPTGFAGVIPDDPEYVIAECDAQESMVPPGCYTPVSRSLWNRGMRVRRDLYEAVMAAHAQRAADGTALVAPHAELPAGRDQLPPEVVAAPRATTVPPPTFVPGPPAPGVVAAPIDPSGPAIVTVDDTAAHPGAPAVPVETV